MWICLIIVKGHTKNIMEHIKLIIINNYDSITTIKSKLITCMFFLFIFLSWKIIKNVCSFWQVKLITMCMCNKLPTYCLCVIKKSIKITGVYQNNIFKKYRIIIFIISRPTKFFFFLLDKILNTLNFNEIIIIIFFVKWNSIFRLF